MNSCKYVHNIYLWIVICAFIEYWLTISNDQKILYHNNMYAIQIKSQHACKIKITDKTFCVNSIGQSDKVVMLQTETNDCIFIIHKASGGLKAAWCLFIHLSLAS